VVKVLSGNRFHKPVTDFLGSMRHSALR
jgi:hypothetical protein